MLIEKDQEISKLRNQKKGADGEEESKNGTTGESGASTNSDPDSSKAS